MIAKVEPLTRARALRGPYDYRLPPRLGEVGVGSVLRVPFGRQRILGVVVELAERSSLPPERLAEPIEALDAGVPAELVSLALWTARQYCSTPSRGLSLALPPGTGPGGERTRPRTETWARITELGREALAGGGRLGAKQRDVLEALSGPGEASRGQLGESAGADSATLRRLADRELIELGERRARAARPVHLAVGTPARPVRHTPEQRGAIEAIVAAIEGEGGQELLLHGVTGSGKTEVYLAAAERALERGMGILALVPEIALTPQATARFRTRLGEDVAVLHSGLTDRERYDEWRRLRDGEARVCVGPRSAVFAPVRDLGLVIVDEEHDASYKQESDPRYDARRVARERARRAGAALVAGTATPRPESMLALRRLELPGRADGGALPDVELLDMRGMPGGAGPLHERAREELGGVCAGGKAMVLLNRRGFSPHLECRTCGRAWRCPDCDVSLVLHQGRTPRLACHHCGHREAPPEQCPDCGSVALARHGAGTERLAAVLSELVDPAPVFRLDADTAGRGRHSDVLAAFEQAPSGVLVGTQMVAKGHDFANVGLGVVVDADSSLRFPDFRAEERTFALLTQLAGRCGRGGSGRVLIQTLAPGAPAIRAAAAHDSAGFVSAELERRRQHGYPPYRWLVSVDLAAEEEPRAHAAAETLATRIQPGLPGGAELLGPAPRFRIRRRYRRRLLIKSNDRAGAIDAVRGAVEAAATANELRGCAVAVDPDPQ